MAYPRNENFEPRLLALSAAARALSHPARLALVEVLATRSTCTCGELVHELPLAQATVSQHLSVLKDAGFIEGSVDGPRSCYCVDWEAIRKVGEDFDAWFREVAVAGTCC